MMQTIQRANPDVWVTPLRALHAEIDRLIELIEHHAAADHAGAEGEGAVRAGAAGDRERARRRASAGAARRLLRRDEGDRARPHRRHLRRSRRHAAESEPVADREDETELAVPAARSGVRQAAGGDRHAPGAGRPGRVRGDPEGHRRRAAGDEPGQYPAGDARGRGAGRGGLAGRAAGRGDAPGAAREPRGAARRLDRRMATPRLHCSRASTSCSRR